MKLKNYLFSALCALLVASSFAACSSDNNDPIGGGEDITGGGEVEVSAYKAYILYEGGWHNNNTGIAYYAPQKDKEPSFVGDFYKAQNQKGLGDNAQDMIEYDGNLFVTVATSRLLVKLNSECVEVGSLSFTEEDGEPRYLAATGGKLFVTTFNGKLIQVDAATMKREKELNVGTCLEFIAEKDGKLYISDIGIYPEMEKLLRVVDIASFTKQTDIEVIKNPNDLLVANGDIYLISWGDTGMPTLGGDYTLQRIEPNGTISNIGVARKMASYNDVLYVASVATDWSAGGITTTAFYSYNTRTHELSDKSFLKNMPAELATASVYAMNVDPYNGDIYIGVSTSYTTNGDIYRFKADGTFMEKFDCGGINPKKVLFVK
jgi:hypothetical protein